MDIAKVPLFNFFSNSTSNDGHCKGATIQLFFQLNKQCWTLQRCHYLTFFPTQQAMLYIAKVQLFNFYPTQQAMMDIAKVPLLNFFFPTQQAMMAISKELQCIFFSIRSLCWDRWNGTWHPHLTRPCFVALGQVLIWVPRRIGLRSFVNLCSIYLFRL